MLSRFHNIRTPIPLICPLSIFYFSSSTNRDLHSFPTRRSSDLINGLCEIFHVPVIFLLIQVPKLFSDRAIRKQFGRSEEHTSELQSRLHLVCRLLLEKKNLALTLRVISLILSLLKY